MLATIVGEGEERIFGRVVGEPRETADDDARELELRKGGGADQLDRARRCEAACRCDCPGLFRVLRRREPQEDA